MADVPEDELVILLIRTAKAVVDRLRAERGPTPGPEMTAMHGLALHYLRAHDAVTTTDLARHLRITKQSASEVVAVLEANGLVRRAPHPTDGRARVLRLTAAGTAKLRDGRRRWQALEDEWAALIGRRELDGVRAALEAFLAAETATV